MGSPNSETESACEIYGTATFRDVPTPVSAGEGILRDGLGCEFDYTDSICDDKDEPPKCCDKQGNPIHGLTGKKYQEEVFFSSAGKFPLTIGAYYSSRPLRSGGVFLDGVWRWSYFQNLSVNNLVDRRVIQLIRNDTSRIRFDSSSLQGAWIADQDVVYTVEDIVALNGAGESYVSGFIVTTPEDTIETYNMYGVLQQITNRDGLSHFLTHDANEIEIADQFGNAVTYNLDIDLRVESVIDTDGNEYRFQYGSNNNLQFVSFPDETPGATGTNPFGEDNPYREYHYEDLDFGEALTGITDENGDRFATWTYDSLGYASSSEHAGGVEEVNLDFSQLGSGTQEVTDTNALGKQTITSFTEILGQPHTTQNLRLASALSPAASQTFTFDANGFMESKTDWNGNVTEYIHNARELETSRTEAFGTPEARTITTTWHSVFRKPTQIVEPGRTTSFTYDTLGHMLTRTETDTTTQTVPYVTTGRTRTTTFTYYPEGVAGEFQVHTIDGPRTDVSDITTFTYTAEGYIASVSNPLSHITQVTSYNSRGLPLSTTDSNGVVRNMTYHPRGWLRTTTVVDPTPAGNDSVTVNEYDDVGQLIKVTLPNGTFLSYEYDAAHRLDAISNNLGERQEFTLDLAGNITLENTKDSGGSITRTQSRVYDDLSRMIQALGGASQLTEMDYDDNGNNTSTSLDPLGINQSTLQAFDALNRLETVTDALTNDSDFAYDARDNLISITDQRGLTTSYVYDGLNNLIQQTSPDTGVTVFTYDDAGNQLSQTDARGIVTNNVYDALNRLISVSYPGSPTEDIVYSYDQVAGVYGIGRLTQLSDQTGTTNYVYDQRGNQVESAVTIQNNSYTTHYGYDLADNLIQTTYPSGRVVDHQLDSLGRTASITTKPNAAGVAENIASNVDYLPFGPMTDLDYGNNLALSISNDQDYRVTNIGVVDIGATNPDVLGLTYTQNAVDNITAIADSVDTNESQTFIYDLLNRLQDADGDYGDQTYSYDPVGNRLSLTTVDGGSTTVETYTYDPNSNRLLSVDEDGIVRTLQYDSAGNIIDDDRGGDTGFTLEYNDQNRLQQVTPQGAP